MIQAALSDPDTAPVRVEARAALQLIRRLTLAPDEVAAGDIEPLRRLGVSDDAIQDVLYICVLFNIIDRVADATGFRVPPKDVFEQSAKQRLKGSYSLPAPIDWLSQLHRRRPVAQPGTGSGT